jgi:CYTH domain-containing protein
MVKAVQAGQVWRDDASGANFLVTKVYNELFTQYAMLRPASLNAPQAETIRVKVTRSDSGMTLPGYTFTQEAQEF